MNNKRTLVNLYKDCIGAPCTHFLYTIVYQQHKSRDSNEFLSVRSEKKLAKGCQNWEL